MSQDQFMPEEAPLCRDPLTGAVKELFGVSYLFPYQRLVVANLLEAAAAVGIDIHWPGPEETAVPLPDLPEDGEAEAATDSAGRGRQIVILPTGAGKSLCFQFPAMLLSGPTLVIYPILSLMADQQRRLAERGFNPVTLRGAQTREERDSIWGAVKTGKSRFIIANPEVLLSPGVLTRIGELGIIHTVIDEAHCVSEWGESFRPSYLRIGEIIEAAGCALVTAFTATASQTVLEKIENYIFPGGAHKIIGNPDRANIAYHARGTLFRDMTVRDLLRKYPRPAIVFCSSRPGTEQLARYLRDSLEEREIRFYHAGLSREEKKDTEDWYFSSPEGILCATCAYGMGIDKADIRTVIHRDCPSTVEAYLQESGRAGRDGKDSYAVLLWGPEDGPRLARSGDRMGRLRFSQLLAYARSAAQCRREVLLELLDYEGGGNAMERGCCDVCGGTASEKLREEESMVRFIAANRRRYSLREAADILLVSGNYGESRKDIASALSCLMAEGKLRSAGKLLWKKRLTLPQAPVRHPHR